jgi:hypothetical protein
MRNYVVMKPLYNERRKRVLEPGELIDLDEEQGARLENNGVVVELVVDPREIRRYRVEDPELLKLDDMEV